MKLKETKKGRLICPNCKHPLNQGAWTSDGCYVQNNDTDFLKGCWICPNCGASYREVEE